MNPDASLLEVGDPGQVAIAGDWHGDTPEAVQAIGSAASWLDGEDATIILQAGDFGIWSGRAGAEYRYDLGCALREANAFLCFIDGNHEDFDLLATLRGDAGLLDAVEIGERIWHLPRGFRWTWHGREWLALGGAASPDRDIRLRNGWGWWPQEKITDGDVLAALGAEPEVRPAQVMITHEAPRGAPVRYMDPPPSFWLPDDLAAGEDHRRTIADVAGAVTASHLIHGHHHQAYQATVMMDHGPVEVTGLDMNGNPGNWGILDTRTMTWGIFGPGPVTLVRRDT
jgi:hypothetical protein